jgi:hypothetical protein
MPEPTVSPKISLSSFTTLLMNSYCSYFPRICPENRLGPGEITGGATIETPAVLFSRTLGLNYIIRRHCSTIDK